MFERFEAMFDTLFTITIFGMVIEVSFFDIFYLTVGPVLHFYALFPDHAIRLWRSKPKPAKCTCPSPFRGAFPQFALLPPEVQETVWEFASQDRDRAAYMIWSENGNAGQPGERRYRFALSGLKQAKSIVSDALEHRQPCMVNQVPLLVLLGTCQLSRVVANNHIGRMVDDLAHLHEVSLMQLADLAPEERLRLRDHYAATEIDGPSNLGILPARNEPASRGQFSVSHLAPVLPIGKNLPYRVAFFWPPAASLDPNENILLLADIILSLQISRQFSIRIQGDTISFFRPTVDRQP